MRSRPGTMLGSRHRSSLLVLATTISLGRVSPRGSSAPVPKRRSSFNSNPSGQSEPYTNSVTSLPFLLRSRLLFPPFIVTFGHSPASNPDSGWIIGRSTTFSAIVGVAFSMYRNVRCGAGARSNRLYPVLRHKGLPKPRSFEMNGISLCLPASLVSASVGTGFALTGVRWLHRKICHSLRRPSHVPLGRFTARDWILQVRGTQRVRSNKA